MKRSGKNTNSSKIVAIFVVIVIIFAIFIALAIGSFVLRYYSSPALRDQQKVTTEVALDIETYPDSYTSSGLPQYPNAKLTNLSKKNSTAKDGVSVLLYSNDAPAVVAKYYDEQLKSLGWSMAGYTSKYTDMPYSQEYKKGDESFIVLVNSSDTGDYKTAISITWKIF